MRWTYQPTVFNTNPKCSIPTQSIRCWPRVFNTKACQCTVFNSQYSSSIQEVDIPTHSGGQRTPRVPLQFPPFLLTLLSYWASSTFITSRTFFCHLVSNIEEKKTGSMQWRGCMHLYDQFPVSRNVNRRKSTFPSSLQHLLPVFRPRDLQD